MALGVGGAVRPQPMRARRAIANTARLDLGVARRARRGTAGMATTSRAVWRQQQQQQQPPGSDTRGTPRPFSILLCGTDSFARTVLQGLLDEAQQGRTLWERLELLVPPDAANSWNSRKRVATPPTKLLALERGIEVHTVPALGLGSWQPSAALLAGNPLLLTASFGHLVPPALLSLFPAGQRLNLHPSLLPQLRGAAPIQWAIARRMAATGVSVQELGDRFDTGRVLAQARVEVPQGARYESLEARLAERGTQLLVDTLRNLDQRLASAWEQSGPPSRHLTPTRAPKLVRSHAEVRWDEWEAEEVEARSRAFGYLYPLTTNLLQAPSSPSTPAPSPSSYSAVDDGKRGGDSAQRNPTAPPLRVILHDVATLASTELERLDARAHALLFPTQTSEHGGAVGGSPRATPPSPPPPPSPGHACFSRRLDGVVVRCASAQTALVCTRLQTSSKPARRAREWIVGYRDRGDGQGRLRFCPSVDGGGGAKK